jgi:hypothetical protein
LSAGTAITLAALSPMRELRPYGPLYSNDPIAAYLPLWS